MTPRVTTPTKIVETAFLADGRFYSGTLPVN